LDRLAEIISLPAEPPLSGIPDLEPLLDRLRVQGVLSAPELSAVAGACRQLEQVRSFLKEHRGQLGRTWSLVARVGAPDGLGSAIADAIDDGGELRDSASPRLGRVRRDLRTQRNTLVRRLERAAADNPGWFSGGVTIRGDRLVLPVPLEHRGRVPGVVHASSSSGQTLFVEPFAVVDDGNRLQELRDVEAEEEARILGSLSRLVGGHGPELSAAIAGVAELDLLVAMRRFAGRFECVRPELADPGRMELVAARHPLLLQRRVPVVPLDFELPTGSRVVVVSGPNAGGKTVMMKTIGLLGVMFASGMFIPAAAGTRLPLFRRVVADIGDEQSIESDLSSFTAHVARLSEMLAVSDGEVLVLADEIGASTSPEEGAALAMAVLEALRDRGAVVIATTHFGRLKMLVQDEPGMVNAAMEWGEVARTGAGRRGPTYRLKMGVPGESSALEIAEEAGLPGAVVARARVRAGREWLDLSEKIRSFDVELDRLRRERAQAEADRAAAANVRRNLEKERAELAARTREATERLRAEREQFLLDKRREIENLVRRIRERGADRESVVAAKRRIADELETAGPDPVDPPPLGERAEPERSPVAGDAVESRLFSRQGTLLEVDGSEGTVAFGQVRMRLPLADLSLVEGPVRAPAAVPTEPADEPYLFNTRLSVIGMSRDEAGAAVGRFLDEAVLQDARELMVVHGKGTGVLRRALWEMLGRDARVETMRLAEGNQGGAGVTLVRLKPAPGGPA
jgi:DNA mismatch repair protein MutS2